MEYAGFLDLPHQNKIFLNIITWNINSAKTKLDKLDVYNFLLYYDLICLNEVKTPLHVGIPGYVSYKSKAGTGEAASRRGGTVVLVRNYLSSQVYNVDLSITDQVWLRLRCVPDVMFGFCYIPPSDSPYFNHHSFVTLHEKNIDFRATLNFV